MLVASIVSTLGCHFDSGTDRKYNVVVEVEGYRNTLTTTANTTLHSSVAQLSRQSSIKFDKIKISFLSLCLHQGTDLSP